MATRDEARAQYGEIVGKYGKRLEDESGALTEEGRQFEDEWKNSSDSGLMQGPGYERSFADRLGEIDARENIRKNRPTASGGGIGGDADLNGDGVPDDGRSGALRQLSASYNDGGVESPLSAFMQQMQARDAQQQHERGQLREILMGQLGALQKPVGVDDPGIRDVIGGARLSGQRESERNKAMLAERLGARGLSDSGALEGGLNAVDEHRAEGLSQFTGNVLHQEQQQRRQILQQMLASAMQIGDAESARTIASQLQGMGLGQNQSQFLDQQAFNYASLNQNANQAALMALLNAF